MDESFILPGLTVLCLLCGLKARVNVYGAFVRGAGEGLKTLVSMAPYLAAVLSASALLRETGVLAALERTLEPALALAGIPSGAASVILLRPLSGSAALAACSDVLASFGADSRAGRLCSIICGASETVFFTGSLYLGAAGVRHARYAAAAALGAYAAGVCAAAVTAGM